MLDTPHRALQHDILCSTTQHVVDVNLYGKREYHQGGLMFRTYPIILRDLCIYSNELIKHFTCTFSWDVNDAFTKREMHSLN
jgi:hypothetical protein